MPKLSLPGHPAAPLAPAQPLLTIAIPTFNRAPFLLELLNCFAADLPADGSVELLISDNCSTDSTVPDLQARIAGGLPLRLVTHPENRGADANFLHCLQLARGRYFWLLGDDDILLPRALPQLLSLLHQCEQQGGVDLVYLSSLGFTGAFTQPPAHAVEDRLGRFAEIVTEPAYFLHKVNALIGLISVILIHRERLLATPHPPLDDLAGSNLLQLGWTLPLVRPGLRVLFVWQRLLAYRHFNSGGWGACEVFGLRLDRIARSLLPSPHLADALVNGVLQFWMPDTILAIRSGHDAAMNAEPITALLAPRFRRNPRYQLCVRPVATLPLPLARLVHRLLKTANRLFRITEAVTRRLTRPHDITLTP